MIKSKIEKRLRLAGLVLAICLGVAFGSMDTNTAFAGYATSSDIANETPETATSLDSNCLVEVFDIDADDDGTVDDIDSDSAGDADYVTCTDIMGLGSTFSSNVTVSGEITFSSKTVFPTEDTTATNVLTSGECGKTIFLNSATEFATTLPAPSAGCEFKFFVKAAPSGADYTIATNAGADVIVITVNELETDSTEDGVQDDNADVINIKDGLGTVGDFIGCNSDGTKWYCVGQVKLDGAITTSTT